MRFDLSDPNAPTRVSGFWKKPLREWAAARNRRLPDRGGFLPFHGVRKFTPNGKPGGVPRGPYDVNLAVARNPMLTVPAALAARAEALRRQVRRERLSATAPRVLLGGALTWSGLEHAKSLRFKDTPSGYRGALRDRRHHTDKGGVQFYEQEVAPFSVVKNLTKGRILAEPRAVSSLDPGPRADFQAGADMNVALRHAVGTASGYAVGEIRPAETTPATGSGPLAMLLVAAAFFFVFWRR